MNPIAARPSGGTNPCSKEYLRKNATVRSAASPPSQENSSTPMKISQLNAGFDAGGGGDGRGGWTMVAGAA
jgi:hypothetical protein